MTAENPPVNPSTDSPRRRSRMAWWLLLTVPVSLIPAFFAWFFASLANCGFSGCSGSGFGVSYGPVWTVLLLNALVGVFIFLGIAIIPWGARRQRLTLAAVIGLGIAAVCALSMMADRFG